MLRPYILHGKAGEEENEGFAQPWYYCNCCTTIYCGYCRNCIAAIRGARLLGWSHARRPPETWWMRAAFWSTNQAFRLPPVWSKSSHRKSWRRYALGHHPVHVHPHVLPPSPPCSFLFVFVSFTSSINFAPFFSSFFVSLLLMLVTNS